MAELPNLDDVKAYARVDTADDDVTLSTLLVAALEYVQQAIGTTYTDSPTDAPERARFAIMALVAHWYRLPEPVADGDQRVVPMHVRTILHQLRGGRLEPECVEEVEEA